MEVPKQLGGLYPHLNICVFLKTSAFLFLCCFFYRVSLISYDVSNSNEKVEVEESSLQQLLTLGRMSIGCVLLEGDRGN